MPPQPGQTNGVRAQVAGGELVQLAAAGEPLQLAAVEVEAVACVAAVNLDTAHAALLAGGFQRLPAAGAVALHAAASVGR